MSDGRHKALKQAVQRMLNSMEALSVDASGITRGSWVQAHLKEVQDLLWEAPPIPAPAPTPASGVKVGLLDLSNLEVSVPAPEPKGFGLDAQIDKIMATMPKDWNGKYFFLMISRMVETFIRKNTDYAGLDNQAIDCLANFRASTQLNVTPLKGVLVRCSDKWMRIQNLTREDRVGMVKDEAIVDTMLDLANYMIIAIMVHMTTNDIKGE